jgi:hypothetical protein
LGVAPVVGMAPEEEAGEVEDDTASGAMHGALGSKQTSGGGIKATGQGSGVGTSGGPTEPTSASTTTAEKVLVGERTVVAIQTVAAANGCDAVKACGGAWDGVSGGPTEPTPRLST